jgi:hypothetical protein
MTSGECLQQAFKNPGVFLSQIYEDIWSLYPGKSGTGKTVNFKMF